MKMTGQVDLLGNRILRQMQKKKKKTVLSNKMIQSCAFPVLCSVGAMRSIKTKLCYMFSTVNWNLGQFYKTCNIQAVICNTR